MNGYDAVCIVCGQPVRGVSGAVQVHGKCAQKLDREAEVAREVREDAAKNSK